MKIKKKPRRWWEREKDGGVQILNPDILEHLRITTS
jgi:hypothetical protein